MGTRATIQLRKLAADWEKLYESARCAGIVPDARHLARGGYHVSRKDQRSTNYSVIRSDDKGGPDDVASAIDMGMNKADMVLCTSRLEAVFRNVADPRRRFINAFNGWSGSGAAKRFDMVSNRISTATADHKTHVHAEPRRRYAESTIAMIAIRSAIAGQAAGQYREMIGVPTVAVPVIRVAPPPYPGRILRRNDNQKNSDSAVRMVQARLKVRGWVSLGEIDGFFGAKLERAVTLFQKQCGVSDDGVIGPKTWPLFWSRPVK